MAGKAIDNSARGVLILIIPFAFAIVILFKIWPVLLALVVLGGSWSIWQRYQWQKWSQLIDPVFHQLIRENRGCLTPLDLSIKANLSGIAAKRYLDAKADEFGAQVQNYQDKAAVYYFITAHTLGSIFDDGTPNIQLEREEKELVAIPYQEYLPPPPPDAALPTKQIEASVEEGEEEEPEKPLPEEEKQSTELLPKKHRILQSLIQSELARRLDVHSSTVMKRRDDKDFAEWSRSRDPEGIAWEYSPDTREFYPVENQ